MIEGFQWTFSNFFIVFAGVYLIMFFNGRDLNCKRAAVWFNRAQFELKKSFGNVNKEVL
jgi:hypothetical protein